MTVQTLGLILATLMTIVAAVGWSRCRKLAFDLKQVKHDLDLTINEKENLIKAQTGTKAQGGASERTVLALAGEISRIENNLTYMDDVPGRKQLHKCIERMKTYLHTENYDIVPLIGSKYNEGMMASAVFVHDDKLLLTFNFKDGTRTITLTDAKIAEEKNTGSNLDCSSAPKIWDTPLGYPIFLLP